MVTTLAPSPLADLPAPLCGHDRSELLRAGHRARCQLCGSFWDLSYAQRPFRYSDQYPQERGHFADHVGRLKVRTLERWLRKASIEPLHRSVCEVGFGGGACLAWLAEAADHVSGVEAVDANLEHARDALGIHDVHHCDKLPDALDVPVDLWIFQDSFEHLHDPTSFLEWLESNSTPNASVLLVAPEAGTLSERILGRAWPHRIPDHRFHWSRLAIREMFAFRRYRLTRTFSPVKFVSLDTVLAHAAHKLGLTPEHRLSLPRLDVSFNFGEMGLVLERVSA